MESKQKAVEAIYIFIKKIIESDEQKSPEMITAISELMKSLP